MYSNLINSDIQNPFFYGETFEKINEQKLFDTLVDLVNKLHKTSITLSKILPINENTNKFLKGQKCQ